MTALPLSANSPLVRTDFNDEAAWARLISAVQQESPDGFRAYVEFVDDKSFAGVNPSIVRSQVPLHDEGPAVAFIADTTTLAAPDFPILVVDLAGPNQPFRCIASEMWGVENNLNLANMGWSEFVAAADASGVFRGF